MMTVGLRPAAPGPGDLGAEPRFSTLDQARRMGTAIAPDGSPAGASQTEAAAPPPGSARETEATTDRALPPELIAPQPPAEGQEGRADPVGPRDDPSGPLKTYAQIPMEIVQEISRLREEAAQMQIEGVPGRNDPTPMPARPEAIGTRVPYDAA